MNFVRHWQWCLQPKNPLSITINHSCHLTISCFKIKDHMRNSSPHIIYIRTPAGIRLRMQSLIVSGLLKR